MSSQKLSQMPPVLFLSAVALVAGVIVFFGITFLRYERAKIISQRCQDIASVSTLRTLQIEEWREDRIKDMEHEIGNPFLVTGLVNWLGGTSKAPTMAIVLQWLANTRHSTQSEDVILYSPSGGIIANASGSAVGYPRADANAFQEALGGPAPSFGDIFTDASGHACLDVFGAVRDAAGLPIAVLALRTDARSRVFPILDGWPVPSQSAETFLVERKANHVRVISPLRFNQSLSSTLRIPLARADEPAVQAVRGTTGTYEGTDYRGKRVYADLHHVDGSNWYLVGKEDASEVITEAQFRTGVIVVFLALAIAFLAAFSSYLYRASERRTRRALVLSEKRASEIERESETILRSIGDAVIATDALGKIVHMNPTAQRMTGWSEEAARGRPAHDVLKIVDETTRSPIASPVDQILKSSEPMRETSHEMLISPDCSGIPIVDSTAPILDAEGHLRGVVVIMKDVTRERKAQEAIRRSEERLRATFMNAPFGVFYATIKGKVRGVNFACTRILGYDSPDELTETLNRESVDKVLADPSRRSEIMGQILAAQGWSRTEVELLRKSGGTVPVALNIRAFRRSRSESVEIEGFVEDQTERNLAIEERKRAEEQLVQAQKMEAVGRLAGGIAHDFNNLLTVIAGYGDLAIDSIDPDVPLHEYIDQIRKATARAALLTSQLLAFSRRQVLELRTFDLGERVERLSSMLARILGGDIRVKVVRRDLGCTVKADANKIEQAIMNLASNSRDAMPRGGTFTLEVSNLPLDASFAVKDLRIAPGNYVVLRVSDTGEGMDDRTLKHLFEPFFTTKEKGKGTGLGLATVFGIVKQIGGHIFCSSEPERGTTFDIYIPRDVSGTVSPCEAAQIAATAGDELVLVVDDEECVLDATTAILKSGGYGVIQARGAGDLDLALASTARIPELLITDVVMPGKSGSEVAADLVERYPGLPVLFVSGYTEEAIADLGVLEEDVNFLGKPFTAAALLAKVRSVLDRKRESSDDESQERPTGY